MCLQWSSDFEAHYRAHVIDRVLYDPRSDFDKATRLGFPFDFIRKHVIRLGLADFDRGYSHPDYGTLTADDAVLLYCFSNMRQHFFESVATFKSFKSRIGRLLNGENRSIVVDLGCGPGTAGLALAEVFSAPLIDYIGVDRPKAMLKKAKTLLEAAKVAALFDRNSKFGATSSWTAMAEFPQKLTEPTDVLINATYLFASDSLLVEDVCRVAQAFQRQAAVKNLLFCFANTRKGSALSRFESFKKKTCGSVASSETIADSVEFRKKRFGLEICRVEFCRELLILKRE